MSRYQLHNAGYGQGSQPEIVRSEGAYLYSDDGRRLFDAGLGAGSQILGHAHPAVVAAVQRQIADGSIYLYNNPQIHDLCQRLTALLPAAQSHFVFSNSGTEATLRALRLARAATSRQRIACFHGGWHGMNEWTLLDDGGRFGAGITSLPDGIPQPVLDFSLLLPYNDERAFELLNTHGHELAAVIIEPVQGSNPRADILPFLQRLEAECRRLGILVIHDEIITGFRLAPGGAGQYWPLQPDIVTWGKILGGGLPIGLTTCTDEVAARTFGDRHKRILTGGTFSANPLVAAASSAVLSQLVSADYRHIDELGERFRSLLNQGFKLQGLPMSAIGIGSFNRVAFTASSFRNRAERDALELPAATQYRFRQRLLDNGVLWPTNGIVFTGFCHEQTDIDWLYQQVLASAAACINGGG